MITKNTLTPSSNPAPGQDVAMPNDGKNINAQSSGSINNQSISVIVNGRNIPIPVSGEAKTEMRDVESTTHVYSQSSLISSNNESGFSTKSSNTTRIESTTGG